MPIDGIPSRSFERAVDRDLEPLSNMTLPRELRDLSQVYTEECVYGHDLSHVLHSGNEPSNMIELSVELEHLIDT